MAVPNTPTAVERVGLWTDTTPLFQADVESDNANNYEVDFRVFGKLDELLLTEDGLVLDTESGENLEVIYLNTQGSVTSPLYTGDSTVQAEYTPALPVGTYVVEAKTTDTVEVTESTYSEFVTFLVTSEVLAPRTLNWNVRAFTSQELALLWNTRAFVQDSNTLAWNVRAFVQDSSVLRWEIRIFVENSNIFSWQVNQGLRIPLSLIWATRTPWVTVEYNSSSWQRLS